MAWCFLSLFAETEIGLQIRHRHLRCLILTTLCQSHTPILWHEILERAMSRILLSPDPRSASSPEVLHSVALVRVLSLWAKFPKEQLNVEELFILAHCFRDSIRHGWLFCCLFLSLWWDRTSWKQKKIYREEAAYRMQPGSRRIKEGTRQDLAPKDNAPSLHPARDYLIQCLDFPK